jgi:hypothetical protein
VRAEVGERNAVCVLREHGHHAREGLAETGRELYRRGLDRWHRLRGRTRSTRGGVPGREVHCAR